MHEQENGEAQQNDVWVHIEKVFMKIVNIIDIKIVIIIIYVGEKRPKAIALRHFKVDRVFK